VDLREEETVKAGGRIGRIAMLVFGTVILNLVGMFVLKTMVVNRPLPLTIVAAGLAVVMGMHVVRFLLWGSIHEKSALNFSYALTSVYYLTIIPVMHYFGEIVRWQHYAGSILIVAGVAVVMLDKQRNDPGLSEP
jgi:drug/metabolite transporter (DMT)-like permease